MVKELVSKTNGLCPREFESRRCRFDAKNFAKFRSDALNYQQTERDRGVAVSRLLRMQKAPGSNPGDSNFDTQV